MQDKDLAFLAISLLCFCGGVGLGHLLGRLAAWPPILLAAAAGLLSWSVFDTAKGWDQVAAAPFALGMAGPAALGLLVGDVTARSARSRRRARRRAGPDP